MTFYDELYFEITVKGAKRDIKKFASFLRSGELDEFFEIDSDFLCYDDDFYAAENDGECTLVFTNDDNPIEIDEFDSDEFLEVLCHAAKALDLRGTIYDADDEELSFFSKVGDSYYLNSKHVSIFNDELDEKAMEEESEEDDD